MDGTEQVEAPLARPRKRITKACDQCNRSRSKCDGSTPCSRCRDNVMECSYERVSRRQGRVAKAHSRRSAADGTSNSGRERALLQNDGSAGAPRSASSMDRSGYSAGPTLMQPGQMQMQPASTTPSAWFANENSFGDIYSEPYWLGDGWTPNYDALRLGGAHLMDSRIPTSQNIDGSAGTPRTSDGTLTSAPQALRYPVLQPVIPYLSRLLSPSLACDLLESYLADVADGIPSPSSPLLLAHIYRKESLLSTHKPRPCTPALLASMLLIAAHTTEFPFFGSTPLAREKLQSGLLRLSLALMDRLPEIRNRGPSLTNTRNNAEPKSTVRSESGYDPDRPQYRRPRTAYLDDIVTYMHIALVTMTTESKPPGVHWWHTAFQLAKEYRLNRDIGRPTPILPPTSYAAESQGSPEDRSHFEQSNEDDNDEAASSVASPMSVSDDAIVEHSKTYPTIPSSEECEERRRVWWTLYIWDRHLALRYNSPLSIKDAESQDVYLPLDDSVWQAATSSTENPVPPSLQDHKGPPSTIRGDSAFDVLVPLMCILGQIIDMQGVAYHPRVERSTSNPVAEAYISTITQQLRELEPSIVSWEASMAALSMSESIHDKLLTQHKRLLISHARFLRHLLYVLLGGQWDKQALSERIGELAHSNRFTETLERSLLAADCLNDILIQGPDLGFKAMFFGIFIYHGSTLPWAVTMHFKHEASAKVIHACDTYVRAFEALNCTYQTEYLRKMRKLLLLTLKETRYGTPLSKAEQHLRKHIIKLYRWTGDGTGLGL